MDEGEPIRTPITDVLDLQTIPPRDAKAVNEASLDEVAVQGF